MAFTSLNVMRAAPPEPYDPVSLRITEIGSTIELTGSGSNLETFYGYINPTGEYIYLLDVPTSGNVRVHQVIADPFDPVIGAPTSEIQFSSSDARHNFRGIHVNSTGTRLFIYASSIGRLYYVNGSSWSFSGANLDSASYYDVSGFGNGGMSFTFSPTGSFAYVLGDGGYGVQTINQIRQITCSTPYAPSVSDTNILQTLSEISGTIYNVVFANSGNYVYVFYTSDSSDGRPAGILRYTLSIPYDITTRSSPRGTTNNFYTGGQAFVINSNGTLALSYNNENEQLIGWSMGV